MNTKREPVMLTRSTTHPNLEVATGKREPAQIIGLRRLVGLSEHHCSMIRLGKRVPHAPHWEEPLKVSFPRLT